MASVHWERRLFDSLIPLPDGTSYNASLVEGSNATGLIDPTDPALRDQLLVELDGVESIDYVVSQHSEQDHSGVIPDVLERYPSARLVCSRKAEDLMKSLLSIADDRIQVVKDGESGMLFSRRLS